MNDLEMGNILFNEHNTNHQSQPCRKEFQREDHLNVQRRQ